MSIMVRCQVAQAPFHRTLVSMIFNTVYLAQLSLVDWRWEQLLHQVCFRNRNWSSQHYLGPYSSTQFSWSCSHWQIIFTCACWYDLWLASGKCLYAFSCPFGSTYSPTSPRSQRGWPSYYSQRPLASLAVIAWHPWLQRARPGTGRSGFRQSA